jgi:hypothetical protein
LRCPGGTPSGASLNASTVARAHQASAQETAPPC